MVDQEYGLLQAAERIAKEELNIAAKVAKMQEATQRSRIRTR